ncbi:hypothetical protein ABIC28_002651 [Rhodococcus sp. PvR044]|nr:hypothetical protein C8K38_10850 [Rhodococcus sp. OK611]SNX91043.1 hypothetical protein SAMN05447004_10849 [Rhodococcus sp. OK270]
MDMSGFPGDVGNKSTELGEIMLGLFLGLGSTALALGLGVGLALTIGLALGSAALGLGLLISDAAIKYNIDELED